MCKVVTISKNGTFTEFASAQDLNYGRSSRWRKVDIFHLQNEARGYRSKGFIVLDHEGRPFEFAWSGGFFENMESLSQEENINKQISASPDFEFSKVYIREYRMGKPDEYEVLEICELEYEDGLGCTIIRDNGQRFSGSALNHLCLQVLRKVANTFGIALHSFSAGGRHE